MAGAVYPIVKPTFHLELADPAVLTGLQRQLLAATSIAMLTLLAAMGIDDRVVHPEALEGARFVYGGSLRRSWSPRFLTARAEYGVFVPAELQPYVV